MNSVRWKKTKLGKVISFQRGYDLPNQLRANGLIPVVGGGGVNGSHNKSNVKGPGVVIGRSGSGFGSAHYINCDFWALNTGLFVKNYHGNDVRFVYYFLDYMDFRKYNSGGAQPSLNRNFIYPIKVSIPHLTEQKEIVRILMIWDRAIDLIECLIASKKELRKGLMQQLFTGKRRLPGFITAWKTVRIGRIFKNRTESNRADLPLMAITGDRGLIPRNEVGRKDSSSADKSRYLRICQGDIGYNTMRMWQGVSALSGFEGIVSPAYTIVSPLDEVDGEFMALFFKFPHTINLFFRYSQGLVSDTLNLKFNNFAKIQVTIPEKSEQQAIKKIFHKIDKEIGLLGQILNAFKEQKKGLMQQLLTGKVRVKVPES